MQVGVDDNKGNKAVRSLGELFCKEFQSEPMIGENQIYCFHCKKKTDSTKQVILLKYPKYLNITLKMFNMMGEKLPRLVAVPFHLNLVVNNYMLLSAIIHTGCNATEGHYTQFGRSVTDANIAWQRKTSSGNLWSEYGQWIYTNDQIKRKCSSQDVKTALGLGRKKRSVQCAYNVTYIRMDEIHGIAVPTKMPNIPLYDNEAKYDHVTIEDWNIDNDDHDDNKSQNDVNEFINDDDEDNESFDINIDEDNDWNLINVSQDPTQLVQQQGMQIDDENADDNNDDNEEGEDVHIIEPLLNLPQL